MNNEISALEPRSLWRQFAALCAIPHPSRHEEAVRRHLMEVGRQAGAEVIRDEVGNVVLRKGATPGLERLPGVILQGHMDMVPQANSDSDHDFIRDPIRPRIDGEWVTATGTTLGADNGIGIAAALAVLTDPDVEHGPLELLITSNEEDGMDGAFGLKPGLLKGRYLLNLDSEDEGVLCIGCAGGANVDIAGEYASQPAEGELALRISVAGLHGGHSGVDIHRGRGNANKVMARLLRSLEDCSFDLVQLQGGTLRNAIPREAAALLTLHDEKAIREAIESEFFRIRSELAATEPDLSLRIEAHDPVDEGVVPGQLRGRLIDALCACQNGVQRMSDAMPGLVETSSNLARVTIAGGRIHIQYLVRSFVDSARDNLCRDLCSQFALVGLSGQVDGVYPGWKPDPQSALLKRVGEVHRELFGKLPEIGGIHAGLECGILGATYPHWQMLSFGPTIRFPHSPDERVHVESVGRFWKLLRATLKALPVE